MSAVLDHVRRNVVGYIALFVALGGTGYAAIVLPAGSVNGPAIQNHVIGPVKFDRKLINGSVRAWASVSASGRVLGGAPKGKVGVGNFGVPGVYGITWRSVSLVRCAPIASVDDSARLPPDASVGPGFALASVRGTAARRGIVVVNTYDFTGQRAALPFNVAVVC